MQLDACLYLGKGKQWDLAEKQVSHVKLGNSKCLEEEMHANFKVDACSSQA